MGTSLNYNAQNFWFGFDSDVVTEDLPKFISIVADTMQNPLFLPKELDKEKKQLAARIQSDMNDTGQVASNALYSTIYKPECVYYSPTFQAQLDQLARLTSDDLRAFHKAHITPANTVFAVVGDVEPDAAFKLVEDAFGSWSGPPAEKISTADCANPTKAMTIEHNLPEKTNIDVLMGYPGAPGISDKDFLAASIANSALGHDTLSSRLAEIRTKHGLTYGIGSYFTENAYENGAWVVSYTVNPENLNKSFPLVRSIVDKYIKEGISQKELKDEAQRLGGEYMVERMRTPHQLADAITKYEFLGLGVKFMDEYPVQLQQVTQAQVNEAIRKYFTPDKMVTSIAGTLPKK
jgi:zinc protease